MTEWKVYPDSNDPEMSEVRGVYVVASNLPVDDAAIIAAGKDAIVLLESFVSYFHLISDIADLDVSSELASIDKVLKKAYCHERN